MMRLIGFILDLLLGWLFEDEVVEMPCETVEMPETTDTQRIRIRQTVFEYVPKVVDAPQAVEQPIAISWREFTKYNQLVNSYLTSKGGD